MRPVEPLEAEIFALAILDPVAMRQRVSELYEPGRRTLEQRVSIELQIPGELITAAPNEADTKAPAQASAIGMEVEQVKQRFVRLGRVALPVFIPLKGELNDNLTVRGGNDELLPVFSYSEYLLVVASVLRMLLLKAYRLDDVLNLPKEGKIAEREALACVMSRGTPAQEKIDAATGQLLSLANATTKHEAGAIRDEQTLRIAAELVRKLSNRYAIVASAECSPEGRLIVQYQRTIVPQLSLGKNARGQRFRWLLDYGSIFLGARPVDLTVPLENASTCQSFHLEINCPEGLYLRNQQLSGVDAYLNRYGRSKQTIPPYYRLRRRLGQPYAHLYTRYFPAPKPQEKMPDFKVAFREVPPGSLFRAAVVAASTAALVWLVGWVLPRVPQPDTDVPAVILAFPAVAAAWLGFDEKRRRLLEGTLVARASLIVSACMALAASALFMANRAPLPVLHRPIPFPINISFLGINQGSWGILAGVALFNALIVGYRAVQRTQEFRYLSTRSDPMATAREGRWRKPVDEDDLESYD